MFICASSFTIGYPRYQKALVACLCVGKNVFDAPRPDNINIPAFPDSMRAWGRKNVQETTIGKRRIFSQGGGAVLRNSRTVVNEQDVISIADHYIFLSQADSARTLRYRRIHPDRPKMHGLEALAKCFFGMLAYRLIGIGKHSNDIKISATPFKKRGYSYILGWIHDGCAF